jgi:hypothetical protein
MLTARHFFDMKCVSLSLLFAVGLSAGEMQDRAAIDKVITALNDPLQRGRVFTSDADSSVNFDRLLDIHRQDPSPTGAMIGREEPWTELTMPRVASGSIRFITPNVAIVDGASTVQGAITLAPQVPLMFVMKKEGSEWRIDAVRVGMTRAPVSRRQP